jgi:hypothetical protein
MRMSLSGCGDGGRSGARDGSLQNFTTIHWITPQKNLQLRKIDALER